MTREAMRQWLAEAVIEAAQRRLGRPYVWRGKGEYLWSPHGLERHAFTEPVFDCSGLVTDALLDVGGPDLRASHSTQTMFDAFPEAPDANARGVLRFYGKGPNEISHVAICLGRAGAFGGGPVRVIEAAGGDSRTTGPTARAYVRTGFERRTDFVGARLIP